MRRAIEALQGSQLTTVAGDSQMLAEMEDLLGRVLTCIDRLRSAGDDDAAHSLDEVQSLLDNVLWELVDDMRSGLKEKSAAQATTIAGFEASLAQWKACRDELRREANVARAEGAPLIPAERNLLRIDDLVTQFERCLREREYVPIAELLKQCAKDLEAKQTLLDDIRKNLERVGSFARQADLLLLRSPLDDRNKRYKYTVLLRTPSRPGSHGINIQGECTVTAADRGRMRDGFNAVTGAINAGLRRSWVAPEAAAAVRAASSSPNTATAAARIPPVAPVPATALPVAPAAAQPATSGAPGLARYIGLPSADSDLALTADLNELLARTGALMARVVLPTDMSDYISETMCSLTITTNDLELPWELMHANGRFLCADRPVARLPMGRSFPRIQNARPRGKKRFLLIYADPEGNLSAAKKEVDAIEISLNSGWSRDEIEVDVLRREEATGDRLNNALLSGRYDVIHYAGHAAFDQENHELSGLLLHDHEIFFAEKIQRLLEGSPIVFLNACETGAVANEIDAPKVDFVLKGPAEGLASAFVYGGALACIGTMWPVYDAAAAAFANHFYRCVLEGEMVGEAVRLARTKVRSEFTGQVTWAAFVLYGDPTFRLVT
ncbi:MAG: CHAT domain-containing protein [Planctomycetes bacterium]|nr:CHAT domain-containing protein [Planctomycetota bacterium]MBI3843239.1 CHAT domain-containing protein [Planctomycetota bacterium]